MGNHLYEENRRLKAQIADLQERLNERIEQSGDEPIDIMAREALKQILTGKAALVTMPGNDQNTKITYFQMIHPPSRVES